MLGKLPVLGCPTHLDKSRARAYCACSRCGWGLFGHFSLLNGFSFLSPSLWEMARYRLKYCLKGPLTQLEWSDGAKVLGKLPVPGRPTDLDYSRARAYCACSRCGWGLFGHFFSHLSFSLLFLPLSGRQPDID